MEKLNYATSLVVKEFEKGYPFYCYLALKYGGDQVVFLSESAAWGRALSVPVRIKVKPKNPLRCQLLPDWT